MNQFKCCDSARQKCPDKATCGDFTYNGTDCDCAKFNEKCLADKERDIIAEIRAENATLKSILITFLSSTIQNGCPHDVCSSKCPLSDTNNPKNFDMKICSECWVSYLITKMSSTEAVK